MSTGRLTGKVFKNPLVRYTKKGVPWLALQLIEKDAKAKSGIFWNLITFDKNIAAHIEKCYAEGMVMTVEAKAKSNPYTDKEGKIRESIDWHIEKIIELTPVVEREEQHMYDDGQEEAPLFDPDDIPF